MKKNYIQPNINVLTIASQSLMAGSNQQFGAKGEASSNTQVFSRESSNWDDEE